MNNLNTFYNLLPEKPYCSNEKGSLRVLPKEFAIKQKYIQAHHPLYQSAIILDFDGIEGSNLSAMDLICETGIYPNLVIFNKDNDRKHKAHLIFFIDTPIPKTESAKIKPMQYLARIERCLTNKFKADLAYTGFIVKNPFHEDHIAYEFRQEAWTLNELNDYLDLKEDYIHLEFSKLVSISRNCAIFDTVRKKGYQVVDNYRKAKNRQGFDNYILNLADQLNNTLDDKLSYNEIKAIAKSIYNWTWKKYDRNNSNSNSHRGRDAAQGLMLNTNEKRVLSAIKTNQQRVLTTEDKIKQAVRQLQEQGKKITIRAVAEQAGIDKSTVMRHKELIKK